MGCDFGFMTRFRISTTELPVIVNYFTITERKINGFINGSVTFKQYESFLM